MLSDSMPHTKVQYYFNHHIKIGKHRAGVFAYMLSESVARMDEVCTERTHMVFSFQTAYLFSGKL